MSDFFTVIVSNDDCVSLGISIPHDAKLTVTIAIAKAQFMVLFFFMYVIIIIVL